MSVTLSKSNVSRLHRLLKYEFNKGLRNITCKKWFQTEMGRLYLPKPWISDSMLKYILGGMYEKNEITLLKEFFNPSDSVIELGAGIGFLAQYYCKVSSCPHIAIEASPFLSEVLSANTSHFANLRVLNSVARKSHLKNIFYVYDDFWASSLIPIHLENPECKLRQQVEVPTIDLDKLISENKTTFLICDIEGGEKELFETFEVNVPKILLELHWDTLEFDSAITILNRLKSKGYNMFGQPGFVMAVKKD